MDLQTAIDTIESLPGLSDESTAAGEAWTVVLKHMLAYMEYTLDARAERTGNVDLITLEEGTMIKVDGLPFILVDDIQVEDIQVYGRKTKAEPMTDKQPGGDIGPDEPEDN